LLHGFPSPNLPRLRQHLAAWCWRLLFGAPAHGPLRWCESLYVQRADPIQYMSSPAGSCAHLQRMAPSRQTRSKSVLKTLLHAGHTCQSPCPFPVQVNSLPLSVMFGLCSFFLALAVACQVRLAALSQDQPASPLHHHSLTGPA
jgi:hypothetical protein